jgi:hypothetical protein
MSKKMMSMLLASLFTCLTFFDLGDLDFPSMAHAFVPERLFNHCQGVHRPYPRFAQNLMLFLC